MVKREKEAVYNKYIPDLETVKELLTDDHDKIIKILLYVHVLQYIKQRKLRDKITNNSKDDVFQTDIYDFLDDYVLPSDHEKKRKGQLNVDKYVIKKKSSKSNTTKPKSKPRKPSNTPTKPKPLKSPVNIQSNWIFNMQYFELAMANELIPFIKLRTSSVDLNKLSDDKIPIYKFIYYVTEKALQIDDTKTNTETEEELNFIEEQINKLAKIYKSILPEKNNKDLDSHLAEMISNFIKVLAFHAEINIWHSTTSKSCNQTHFITTIDTFRRQTNIPVPLDILKFSIIYGKVKTKKKTAEDKISDQEKAVIREKEKLDILLEKKNEEKRMARENNYSDDSDDSDNSDMSEDENMTPDYPSRN